MPSVLARKSVVSPRVSGSLVFGNPFIDELVVLSPELLFTIMVKHGVKEEAVLENCNLEIIVVIHLMIYFGKRIILSIPHPCFTQEEGLVCDS